jgi:hypothetical protein
MSTDDTDDWPRLSFVDIEASMRQLELGYGQHETLDLRPWQLPTDDFFYDGELLDDVLAAGPSSDIGSREYSRALLGKRLLDDHLSLFEPCPRSALDDPAYRQQIDDRVRRLATENQGGLTDAVIEHVMMRLAPYPLFCPTFEGREELECRAEFLKLLNEQPRRDFDACAKAMRVVWKSHRERTHVYDDDGKKKRRA